MRGRVSLLPALLAGLVLLATAVWAVGAPAEPDATARDGDAPQAGETPTGHLESHRAPDDLEEAEHVAREFALALAVGDIEGLGELAAPAYAEQLVGSQARTEPSQDADVSVDGVTTRDLRDDRVTLQVLVRDESSERPRVEALTLALTRDPEGGWHVADGAW